MVKNLISGIVVSKKFQRQGWGKKLLEYAICKKTINQAIRLSSNKWNKHTIELHKKVGFEVVEEGYYERILRDGILIDRKITMDLVGKIISNDEQIR